MRAGDCGRRRRERRLPAASRRQPAPWGAACAAASVLWLRWIRLTSRKRVALLKKGC